MYATTVWWALSIEGHTQPHAFHERRCAMAYVEIIMSLNTPAISCGIAMNSLFVAYTSEEIAWGNM